MASVTDKSQKPHAGITLWERAYESFAKQNEKLESAFQRILSLELSGSKAQSRDDDRSMEEQMADLISSQIHRMEAREWKLTVGSKTISIRAQIDRIFRVLSIIPGLASQGAWVDPLHAGLPIAGLYLVLAFATRDREARETLLDGLEDIANLVRRYAGVELVYIMEPKSSNMIRLEDAIVKLYVCILVFEAEAVCQFNHNIAYQTFRSLIKGSSSLKSNLSDIKRADETCKALLPVLDQETNFQFRERLLQITEEQKQAIEDAARQPQKHLESIIGEIQGLRVAQQQAQDTAEHQELRVCLRTTDYSAPLKGKRIPSPATGTCEWFLQHPDYHEWLRTKSPALLWTTADPGCGKSVLAKYLVNLFTKTTGTSCHVCYHFFRSGTETGSGIAALCAIMHQLFSQSQQLLESHGLPQFRQNGTKLASFFEPLWEMFTDVVHSTDRDDIVLIIDAWDECESTYRTDLLMRLVELLADEEQTTRIKIIIMSTPDITLRNSLYTAYSSQAFCLIRVQGEQQSLALTQEIDLVVEQSIERFKVTREQLGIYDKTHETLRSKIQGVPHRTYLWVAIIFSELQENAGASEDDILTTIQTMPVGVERAYERRLASISPSNVENAKKILRIVLAADRDLTLQELRIAFTVQKDGSYKEMNKENPRSFEDAVRQWCGLLIRVEEGTVSLIHQTARKYLNSTTRARDVPGGDWWQGAFDTAAANLVLTQSCIWYLGSDTFDQEWIRQNQKGDWTHSSMSLNKFFQENHFVEYAAKHWTVHFNLATASTVNEDLCNEAMKLCRADSNCYRTWSKIYWSTYGRRPPLHTTDLSIAVAFDMFAVMERLISNGYDIDTRDGDGDSALIAAIVHGRETAAKILLECGISVKITAHSDDTPLHSAAAWGMYSIVPLLIEHGAETTAKNLHERTPLHRAAQFGHSEAVVTLLSADAEINARDERGRTPLHLACLRGMEDIKGRRRGNIRRYESVITNLKQAGADPDVLDNDRRTAAELYAESDKFFKDATEGLPTLG